MTKRNQRISLCFSIILIAGMVSSTIHLAQLAELYISPAVHGELAITGNHDHCPYCAVTIRSDFPDSDQAQHWIQPVEVISQGFPFVTFAQFFAAPLGRAPPAIG